MAGRSSVRLASVKGGLLVLVAAGVGLLCALASSGSAEPTGVPGAGAPGGGGSAVQEDNVITLRVRDRFGPWKKSLSLKLVKTRLRSFSVCAIRNWQSASEQFGCDVSGGGLTGGRVLRLEQNPIRGAARRPDSPGWGMLGLSMHDRIEAVLSNTASGNRFGLVHYRVTLRTTSGQVVAQSNRISVNWHR
jgi:hypothetical protein